MKYFAQSKVGSEKTFGSRRSTLIWPEVFSAAIGLQINKGATKHFCNLWLLQILPKRSTLMCQSVHVDEQTSEPELTSDILQSIFGQWWDFLWNILYRRCWSAILMLMIWWWQFLKCVQSPQMWLHSDRQSPLKVSHPPCYTLGNRHWWKLWGGGLSWAFS